MGTMRASATCQRSGIPPASPLCCRACCTKPSKPSYPFWRSRTLRARRACGALCASGWRASLPTEHIKCGSATSADQAQNPPPKSNGTKPDYRINGEYYDCYAPNSASARNIATNLKNQKVNREQADRIVLNLDDTSVTIEVMKKQLSDWPVPGLKQIIAIKGGDVSILVP